LQDSRRCKQGRIKPALPEKLNSITPREQEVLRLISDGSTNREIANQLYIAEGTVKPITHLLEWLNLKNRAN